MNITTPEDEVRRLRAQIEEDRRNWRAKRISYTIALCLMFLIIISLTVAVVYGLKLRTDIRDVRNFNQHQSEQLAEEQERAETREYQLSEMQQDQDSLQEQIVLLRTQRDSLQYQLTRHARPDEYAVHNEANGGAFAYYRRGGQFLPTDSWYDNGYELYVYLHVGDFALTDYGFFRFADLQGL